MLEQTFVNDGMIPFPSFLLHTIVETARPYGWMRLAIVHQSSSSQSLLIQAEIGRTLSSLHLAD